MKKISLLCLFCFSYATATFNLVTFLEKIIYYGNYTKVTNIKTVEDPSTGKQIEVGSLEYTKKLNEVIKKRADGSGLFG